MAKSWALFPPRVYELLSVGGFQPRSGPAAKPLVSLLTEGGGKAKHQSLIPPPRVYDVLVNYRRARSS